MVEPDRHLKLLSPIILDIHKVFVLIQMLSIRIWWQPYTVIPTLLGSEFGVLGCMGSPHDVIMSWLRLTDTYNYFQQSY